MIPGIWVKEELVLIAPGVVASLKAAMRRDVKVRGNLSRRTETKADARGSKGRIIPSPDKAESTQGKHDSPKVRRMCRSFRTSKGSGNWSQNKSMTRFISCRCRFGGFFRFRASRLHPSVPTHLLKDGFEFNHPKDAVLADPPHCRRLALRYENSDARIQIKDATRLAFRSLTV